MPRSSTASYETADDMRDMARQSAERIRNVTESSLFGVGDFAQHSVEQTREAFLGFLSTTQKTLASFDHQALELRQTTLSLAAKTIAGSFELVTNLVRARSAEEIMQLQADFAKSQMQICAEHTRELGRTLVEQTREFGETATQTAADAVRNTSSFQSTPKKVAGGLKGK
jgi:hypothetical protein